LTSANRSYLILSLAAVQHIVPVWFRWDTGAVTIWITETRAWVRNLLRDPRVAFSVQTFEEPYRQS
jgi:hypothetical protein